MANDPNKPKVTVYDEPKEKKGGIPGWLIALIVVAVIVLIVLFFL